MAKFRKIEMSIRHGSGYGHYILSAKYKGKNIEVVTTDSMIYDYLNDDSDKKRHQEAKRSAYLYIWRAHELAFEKRAYKK
jgi:hypothetical protein